MTTKARQIQVKTFDVPDKTVPLGGAGRIEIVHLGETTASRATFQPGFRWTTHAEPSAGTALCQMRHIGCVVSDRAVIQMADGAQRELAAGDISDLPPGHDIWVVGDEPYISVDLSSAQDSTPPQAAAPTVPAVDRTGARQQSREKCARTHAGADQGLRR